MQLTVNSQTRPEKTNPREMRRGGRIPATLYGHQGAKSTAISLDAKETSTLLRHAVVNNTLIELNVTDGDFKGITLLREVQLHPYRDYVQHLSFFSIAAQSSVIVEIPLRFVGVPVGVKVGGGSVDVLMKTLQVSCPPTSVPEVFEVDITDLNVGKGIHVSDVPLPEGVTFAMDTSSLIVSVIAGRK